MRLDGERLYAFIGRNPAGVNQAGLNVFALEPGIVLQNSVNRITRSEHGEHMLHGQPPTSDDRLAAENFSVHRNPFDQLELVD